MPTAYEIWETKQKNNNNVKQKTAYELWEEKQINNDIGLQRELAAARNKDNYSNIPTGSLSSDQIRKQQLEEQQRNIAAVSTKPVSTIVQAKSKPLYPNATIGPEKAYKPAEIKKNVGAFIEQFGEGVGAGNVAHAITNKFTAPIEQQLQKEMPSALPRYTQPDTRFEGANPIVKSTGKFAGQLTKELGYAAAGQGITGASLSKMPWLAEAIQKTPNVIQAITKGGMIGAAATGLKQIAEPKENKPGLKGLATNVALWGGGALGGELASKAIESLAPQLSKIPGLVDIVMKSNGAQTMQVKPAVEALARGASNNLTGTIAALPTVSDKEKKQFVKEFGPNLLAQGIMDVVSSLGAKGNIKISDLEKTGLIEKKGLPFLKKAEVPETKPLIQDVMQAPNEPIEAFKPVVSDANRLPETNGVIGAKKAVNEVPTNEVITIPVVIGKNRMRGKSVGTMIDSGNDISMVAQQKLTNILKDAAKENGIEPTSEWITNSVSNLLKSHQQAIDSGSNAFVGELPNGRKIVLASQNVLDKVDFSKELLSNPTQPEPGNFIPKNDTPITEDSKSQKTKFVNEIKNNLNVNDTTAFKENMRNLNNAKTGSEINLIGFRHHRGSNIEGTGDFYALDPKYASDYSDVYYDKERSIGNLDTLKVVDVSLKNPLVINGGHHEVVRQLIADLPDGDKTRSLLSKQLSQMNKNEYEVSHNEQGYAILDKLIKKAAEQLRYDGIIYKQSKDNFSKDDPKIGVLDSSEVIVFNQKNVEVGQKRPLKNADTISGLPIAGFKTEPGNLMPFNLTKKGFVDFKIPVKDFMNPSIDSTRNKFLQENPWAVKLDQLQRQYHSLQAEQNEYQSKHATSGTDYWSGKANKLNPQMKEAKKKIEDYYDELVYSNKSTISEVNQNGLQRQEGQEQTEVKRPSGQELGIVAKPKLPFLNVEPRNKTMVVNETSEVSPTLNKIVTNKKGRMPMRTLWDNFYQKFVNNQHYIGLAQKTAGTTTADKNMAIMAANSRNAPGTVNYILKDGLVSKEGKEVGGSFKEVIDQVSKPYEQEFNDYLLHRHNIGRMAQEKPVFGKEVTPEMSEQQIAKYEAKFPDFKRIANQYDSFNQKFMNEWAVKTGLISEDTMKHLNEIYPHYTPTYRAMEETAATQIRPGKGFANQPNVLKKATGSERPILNPLETTMQLVDKTVKAAKYNEVGQTIVDAIRKDPEGMKQWGGIIKDPGSDLVSDTGKTMETDGIEGLMDNFVSQYDKPKLNGRNVVRVMENGKPVYLKINKPEFLESVTGLINYKLGEAEKIARMVTTPYKALITGKNPIFAVKNIARDIPTAFINGSEKNPFKFIKNLSEAAKDMATNAESFREYKALGGGNSGFFLEGKGKTSNLKKLYKGEGAVSQFNESIESLPRYAEFKATVQRGGGDYASKMQGIFNANELTVNFARHGNVTKSVDAIVPYLNPSVQGIDKLFRQFQNHPLATVGKGVLIVTIPQIALNLINQGNDNYKQLDNRTKDTYFLIPNYADKGKTFIKIPKSREYGVIFADTFDRVQRGLRGDQHAFDGYLDVPSGTVFTNFSPTNPLENNYLSPIITNLPSNKDFAGRTIVPQGIQSRSPKYQYDENTSEISKAIGQKLNVSPKQADYLIKSYTGVIGTFVLPVTTKSSKGTMQQILGNTVSRNFTADPVFSNDIVNRFYEQKKNSETIKADAKFNNKELSMTEDNKRHQYNVAAEEISKIYDQIRTAKTDEEKRNLRKQINEIAKIATESSVDNEVKETKNDVLEKLGIEPESKQKFY